MNSVEKEVVKASISLLRQKPFYAHVFQQMEKVYVDSSEICTMAIGLSEDGRRYVFFINTSYIESISEKELYITKAIEHEVLHIVLKHVMEDIRGFDKKNANIAMDLACNQFIQNPPESWYRIEDFGFEYNLTWKGYYRLLEKKGNLQTKTKKEKNRPEHERWGNAEENKQGSATAKIADEILKSIVSRSSDSCNANGWGNMDRNLVEEIGRFSEKKKSTLGWKYLLRLFVANSVETDLETTKMRFSKRYGTRPGLINKSRLNLACTIDTSASVSNSDLQSFFREIEEIKKNDVDVTIIEASQKLEHTYKLKDKIRTEVHGRGGTSLSPAMEYVDKNGFDAHVYFTDFEAPKITNRFKTPVLWVLRKKIPVDRYPYKYGKVIVMEKENV